MKSRLSRNILGQNSTLPWLRQSKGRARRTTGPTLVPIQRRQPSSSQREVPTGQSFFVSGKGGGGVLTDQYGRQLYVPDVDPEIYTPDTDSSLSFGFAPWQPAGTITDPYGASDPPLMHNYNTGDFPVKGGLEGKDYDPETYTYMVDQTGWDEETANDIAQNRYQPPPPPPAESTFPWWILILGGGGLLAYSMVKK